MPYRAPVIFVGVDGTLVRSYGNTRIPRPDVIEGIQQLHKAGAVLYCWSSGGAMYARESAEELGLSGCFTAYLPKPDVMVDDVDVSMWRRIRQVTPENIGALVAQTQSDANEGM